MSPEQIRLLEKQIREEIKQEETISEIRKLRKMAEEQNRENVTDHQNFFSAISDHDRRIITVEKKTIWSYTLDYVKEKPYLVPVIIAAGNIQPIIDIIKEIFLR